MNLHEHQIRPTGDKHSVRGPSQGFPLNNKSAAMTKSLSTKDRFGNFLISINNGTTFMGDLEFH